MFLWFVVLAPVVVAEVFRSPLVDYRLVALGAALPLVEVASGYMVGFHTLLAPVVVLAAVMGGTAGRQRLLRRRLLGIPIGMFVHLVLDGTWTSTALFWWPALGIELEAHLVPEQAAALWLRLGSEVVAIGVLVWAWKRYELEDKKNRTLLMSRGHLARGVV